MNGNISSCRQAHLFGVCSIAKPLTDHTQYPERAKAMTAMMGYKSSAKRLETPVCLMQPEPDVVRKVSSQEMKPTRVTRKSKPVCETLHSGLWGHHPSHVADTSISLASRMLLPTGNGYPAEHQQETRDRRLAPCVLSSTRSLRSS
jgi:hypothetical protein